MPLDVKERGNRDRERKIMKNIQEIRCYTFTANIVTTTSSITILSDFIEYIRSDTTRHDGGRLLILRG